MTDDTRAERAFRDAFRLQADGLEHAPIDVVRRRRRWPALTAAAAILVVIGGSVVAGMRGGDGDTSPPTAADPGPAPVDPRMTVTPGAAQPGQVVSITYADDFLRGVAYHLVRDRGAATDLGDPAYYLTAGGRGVSWAPSTAEYGWDDVGVSGPGPDRVQVPDEIDPGEWLVCTANAAEQRCTSLTVAEGLPAPEPVEEVPADEVPPVAVRIDRSGDFLTVTTNGSSSCPNLVESVSRLDDETVLIRTATLTSRPGAPCTADMSPHRDTWPLVDGQAEGTTYAVVAPIDSNEGVRVLLPSQ